MGDREAAHSRENACSRRLFLNAHKQGADQFAVRAEKRRIVGLIAMPENGRRADIGMFFDHAVSGGGSFLRSPDTRERAARLGQCSAFALTVQQGAGDGRVVKMSCHLEGVGEQDVRLAPAGPHDA